MLQEVAHHGSACLTLTTQLEGKVPLDGMIEFFQVVVITEIVPSTSGLPQKKIDLIRTVASAILMALRRLPLSLEAVNEEQGGYWCQG